MIVKPVACNAIKLILENGKFAKFIALLQVKTASRPPAFWLEERVLRTAHRWAFHSGVLSAFFSFFPYFSVSLRCHFNCISEVLGTHCSPYLFCGASLGTRQL